jgi:Arc/MetJ-type ribon-helix-helix transcriptional regulator
MAQEEEAVKSGEYQNASDAVRALQQRRREDALKLKALRSGHGSLLLPSCAPVAAVLLEEKIHRFLTKRLSARPEIEGEFAELAPSNRVEINR